MDKIKNMINKIKSTPILLLCCFSATKGAFENKGLRYIFLLLFCFSAFLLFSFKPLSAQTDTTRLKAEISKIKEDVEKNLIQIKKLQKLKISGYLQGQFEVGQEFATTKVGKPETYDNKRDGNSGNFIRFGIRRGRVNVGWEEQFGSASFQLDISERGVSVKEAYIKASEPWLKIATVTAGIFNRPFGDEISYPSHRRETPEMTVLFQNLFPDEKDLGAMITLAAPKKSKVAGLKLDAGAFCGNGIAVPDNGKIDFIGHLKYDKKWSKISFGIGTSMYYGSVRNTDTVLYKVQKENNGTNIWVANEVPPFQKNIRQYYGVDAQLSIWHKCGQTQLRGEVLFGTQPSTKTKFSSPKGDLMQFGAVPFNYLRKFWGAHIYYVQDIYKTPMALVLKYSYLNPNTQLKGIEIKNKIDLPYHYLGGGLLLKFTSFLQLMCFYEQPFNSTNNSIPVDTEPADGKNNVANYQKLMKEGVFTCRLQFKF